MNEKIEELEAKEEAKLDTGSKASEANDGSKGDRASGSHQRPLNYLYYNVLSLAMFFVLISTLVNIFAFQKELFEKKSLKTSIIRLIENDADLRAVKFLYKNRPMVRSHLFFWFNQKKKSDYRPYNMPLSEILEEIRTEIYLSGDKNSDRLTKLETVINNYNSANPFDKLESGQKDLFENIRIKLADNYPVVSSEVNKLSDELHSKNLLVNEYLSDSKTSLFVSILSAFIAVILAGVQMYQNRKSSSKFSSKAGTKKFSFIKKGRRTYSQHRTNDSRTKPVQVVVDENS